LRQNIKSANITSVMISLKPLRILSIDSLPKQLPLLLLALLVQLASLAPCVSGQQAAPAKSLVLGQVEFMGLRRLTQEQALAISGLQPGDPFSEALIDEGARKLMDSGLFARLGYRVKSTGNQVHVTIQVEEADRALPIVFDNFVWFSDEELFTAIRRDVQFFNGTVPQAGSAAETIANALQKLLDEKKIPGRIEHMPEEDLSHRMSYLFSVKGVEMPACTLHFPGSSGITEDELRKASKQLTERDYSKTSTAVFASITLVPMYRHVGRLRAKFNEPLAVLETAGSPACKGGVSVTIPVEEGEVYSWEKAEWSGNQSVPSNELDEALGMKAGEVADGLKIDKGLREVAKALGHKGYIASRIKQATAFDETNRRVTFKMDITEGPQYHMGTLRIAGLSVSDAERVKEKWKLASGAVYDAAYLEEFLKKDIMEALRPIFATRPAGGSRPPTKIDSEVKADRQQLTVDVNITIK
jgi:outer membrane protein insertion porin family